MNSFKYISASSIEEALVKKVASRDSDFLGGGSNLVDLMKSHVTNPSALIDVTQLPLNEIKPHHNGVIIGATENNTNTANHQLIRHDYPLLTKAILSGATMQIRNMATNAGNLMQRTRCGYFYDTSMPCNKRVPGSGCSAIHGHNRDHAILGASQHCVATHPSDMCVALTALEARVRIRYAPRLTREMPINDFFRLPGNTPHLDNHLKNNELIEAIILPKPEYAKNYYYLKVRDRASYAFALVSVAVGLKLKGKYIEKARIALGGVSHKPWRAFAAESWLTGKRLSDSNFSQAAQIEMRSAMALEHNAFKIELAKQSIVRALQQASGESV